MEILDSIKKDYDGSIPSAVDLNKYIKLHKGDYLSKELADLALEIAKVSERGRFIFRIHDSLKAEQHLMLNAVSQGNYVRPHKHNELEKTESFRLLKGKASVVIFNDDGEVGNVVKLSEVGKNIVTIRPNIWHTIISDEPFVILESKRQAKGGYIAKDDKEFAKWAPEENTEESKEYFKEIIKKI
ncbi:MAG: WbuC family cupin fold metalloprotein [Candidatus Woesebacteria bacterium]|nr:WbuC family cupin fold metalloprotein [Candidatus Woesebacteria bacterium]